MPKSYAERAGLCKHPVAKELFLLMEEKKSNLSVAADVTTSEELFSLIEKVGPEICLLKTHIDILEDFSPEVTLKMRALAKKHRFMIFEDRKFADIGNTVIEQYRGGTYKIADWAEIVNAHIIPGPGIIEGLRDVGLTKGRALLLLAEMSAAGSLATGDYTKTAVAWAKKFSDFVIGFISLGKLIDDPTFVHMTPGVQLQSGKDMHGQQYQTPESVIENGSDVIIVGRGIYGASNPKEAALAYQKRGWEAYERRKS